MTTAFITHLPVDSAGLRDVHPQHARSAHVIALVDGDLGRRADEAELAQVSAERGGGRACGWVLDDAAWRERIARPERVPARCPVDQVNGRCLWFLKQR
jgi:hypothetical protein